MIRIILIGMVSLWASHSFSQKHDYNWVERNRGGGLTGGISAHFNELTDSLEISTFYWSGRVGCPAFSDKSGDLLFFSNNFHIYDGIGSIAPNGDSITVGFTQSYVFDNFPEDYGLLITQTAAAIPINDSLAYWFHTSTEIFKHDPLWAIDIEENGATINGYTEGLYLTKINIQNKKIEINPNHKKVALLKDTLLMEQLTFVKHANGKDWWMMIPEHYSDSIYLYRIYDQTGEIELLGKRYFSDQNDRVANCKNLRPSRDGTVLARFLNGSPGKLDHKLELFHFDRCTGDTERFFFDSLTVAENYNYDCDVAFSENDRFLYVAIAQYILQLDLELIDPFSQIDTIAEWDGVSPYGIRPLFGQLWEVPNGKLLVGSISSTPFLHYIHNPNEKGGACNFEQRALLMPIDSLNSEFYINIISLPTYPPYRMPPLDIDCEVPSQEINIKSVFFSLYPNPAIEEITVQIHGATIQNAHLYDLAGNLLKTSRNGHFLIKDLPSGMYVVLIETDKGIFSDKLMVK